MINGISKALILFAVTLAALAAVAGPSFAAQLVAPQEAANMTLRPVILAQASKAQCTRQCTSARATCRTRQEERYQSLAVCSSEYNKCVAKCK